MHSNGHDRRTFTVAAAQFNPRQDKAANIASALEMVDKAAATGARLVLLPEVWTFMGDADQIAANSDPIPGELTNRLAERARRHGIYLHGGTFYEQIPGDPRVGNTAVVFGPDGDLIAKYRKIHLFDVAVNAEVTFQESATNKPGTEIVSFEMDGMRIGLATCYDLRFPELFRILALQGADLILLPAAFTLMTGKDHWEVLIRARAIENQVYMVTCNQVGTWAPGKANYGRSMIVDPWGTVIATAPDSECVIGATVDRDRIDQIRKQIPSVANRQPEVYRSAKAVAL
ncbi:MAG TPA: carbon-nitrogen hydrolase family protein [Thermomicrobiales bacterium]|nr:carbon-nitrogen hydrolase family protein [Thermomicrobiales bacterium]